MAFPNFVIGMLGSIQFFQFNSNSNSVIFNSNSNSNSTTPNKFQFQFLFQFRTFQFQFQFQFRRIQLQSQLQKWHVDVFVEIDCDYNNKVRVYKIIVINNISLISLIKWLSFYIDSLVQERHNSMCEAFLKLMVIQSPLVNKIWASVLCK